MTIKHAALILNEFYKTIHQLPDSLLKTELEAHVQEMVASMLKSCLVRNQRKNFALKARYYHDQADHLASQWHTILNRKNSLYG